MQKIAIIIPTAWQSPCFDTLLNNLKSKYSVDIFITALIQEQKVPYTFIQHNFKEFNFSQVINFVIDKIGYTNYDYILLLNDDIKPIVKNWLDTYIEDMEKSNANILGAKLLFPNNDRVQHFGVGFQDRSSLRPQHMYYGYVNDKVDYLQGIKSFKAVTFACVMLKAELFNQYKFDENLKAELQDVDFCLQVDKDCFCTANVELYHYESLTRIKFGLNGQQVSDRIYWTQKWGNYIL